MVEKSFEDLQRYVDEMRFKIKTRSDLLLSDECKLTQKKRDLIDVVTQAKTRISASFDELREALDLKQRELIAGCRGHDGGQIRGGGQGRSRGSKPTWTRWTATTAILSSFNTAATTPWRRRCRRSTTTLTTRSRSCSCWRIWTRVYSTSWTKSCSKSSSWTCRAHFSTWRALGRWRLRLSLWGASSRRSPRKLNRLVTRGRGRIATSAFLRPLCT